LFRLKTALLLAAVLSAFVFSLDVAAQQAVAKAPAVPPPPLAPLSIPGDATRGAVLGETCKGCHGVPGSHNAYPSYYVPKLGGQNLEYIEIALQGYRRGTRSHPTMQAQTSSLSDQDIADLATFFSAWAGEPETGKSDASAHEVDQGAAAVFGADYGVVLIDGGKVGGTEGRGAAGDAFHRIAGEVEGVGAQGCLQ